MKWKKLYDVLNKQFPESWRTLAKLWGVTPSVFTRISQGKPLSVDNLVLILKGSKLDLTDFI